MHPVGVCMPFPSPERGVGRPIDRFVANFLSVLFRAPSKMAACFLSLHHPYHDGHLFHADRVSRLSFRALEYPVFLDSFPHYVRHCQHTY